MTTRPQQNQSQSRQRKTSTGSKKKQVESVRRPTSVTGATRTRSFDVLSRMLHYGISNLQDESVQQEYIRSIVTTLANGDTRRVKVVAITPSKVAVMVYNKPVTTARTRTH